MKAATINVKSVGRRKIEMAKKHYSKTSVGSIFCRSVGPGGTDVTFFIGQGGTELRCVWDNENCPYLNDGEEADEDTGEAPDGHNVSTMSFDEIEAIYFKMKQAREGKLK